MKLNIDGTLYDYDSETMTLAEAFALKEATGWGLRAFYDAYNDGEPATYAWIAYLARTRAGEKVEWRESVVDLAQLIDSLNEGEAATDPTGPETVSG